MAFELPNNPTDLKKINGCIKELVDSKIRQKGEEELRKSIFARLKEEYGIERKEANKYFMAAYKGETEFNRQGDERTELECAMDKLNQQGRIFTE